jgi:tetratricopeptide (TPR) repeat protein
MGSYQEAIEKARQATTIDPTEDRAWDIWKKSLGSLGRYRELFEMHDQWLAVGGGQKAARSWADSLIFYLVSFQPETRCERAMAYGPKFLEAIANYLTTDRVVTYIRQELVECQNSMMKEL